MASICYLMMMRKPLIVLVAVGLTVSFVSIIGGQTKPQLNDSAKLSAAAKSFLSAWLVKQNVREAMQLVTAKPLLARECDLPPGKRKVPRAALQRRNIVEQILSSGLKVFPTYESLDSAIVATETPAADWFEVEDTNVFQIIRIKPGQEGYLMCKFEQSRAYREALVRPDVYYVSFKLKNMNDCPHYEEWISAWKKENRQWHLISIGLVQD